MPKVKVNDIQMYYEVKGEGYPLVMVHGMANSLDWWDPRLVQELSENFKTVLFDLRGTGRTDRSDKEYTMKLFADDTVGLMSALEIAKAHVLGWSMGGIVAQELALNHPERVEKLVLYSTSCGAKGIPMSKEAIGEFMRVRTLPREEGIRLIISISHNKDFLDKNPDYVESGYKRLLNAPPTTDEARTRHGRAAMNADTFNRLSGIKAPTLILSGKRDVLVPPENGLILSKGIPNAKLVYLENSGHTLAEDMDEVIHSITEFLL
jgi:pimeloyl-ACP methyl ester carboxylesterase